MNYNIFSSTSPGMGCQSLRKAQNSVKYSYHRSQKTCKNRLFRCFFLYLAHISAAQNFSILTTIGRT